MRAQFHLPLVTYPDPSSFSIVQNAVDFALHHNAGLTASLLRVRMPAVRPRFPSVIDMEKMRSQAESFSAASEAALAGAVRDYALKAAIEAAVVPFEVQEAFVAQTLAELARAYELSIMEASEITKPLVESVLFGSGRPVLLCPTDHVSGRIDTVAIAWDGSATAARALTGARLLLETASKAILISVTDDKEIDKTGRDRLAAMLRSAGLEVEEIAVEAGKERTADVIQSVARENRADLLVAGAYGHSRLREFILGGVTMTLLSDLKLPALISH